MISLTSIKNNLFFILLMLLYVSATFPMGVALTGYSLTTPLVALLAMLTMFNLFFTLRKSDPLAWFIIVTLVYFLLTITICLLPHGYIAMETVKRILLNVAPLLMCFVFIDFFFRAQNANKIKALLFLAFMIIIVRSITAINAEIMIPNIARNSATGIYADIPEFNLIGAGSYQFINGLSFLILPLLYTIRNNARFLLKIFLILVAAFSLAAIVYTAWGTALVVYILLFTIALSPRKQKYIPICGFIICAMLLISITSRDIFKLTEAFFENNATIYDKIVDIRESLIYGKASGQVEGRQALYLQSIDVFISNPLFGDIDLRIGGHAFWIDHLASFGIIGTIPLITAYFLVLRKSSELLPNEYRTYHYLNGIIFFLFGCLKNIVGYEFMIFLCVIGPLLICTAASQSNYAEIHLSDKALQP